MKEILTFCQIIISSILIISILFQSRGTGLGSAWGGMGGSYQSRRGVEKLLFGSSIVLSVLFFIVQMAILI